MGLLVVLVQLLADTVRSYFYHHKARVNVGIDIEYENEKHLLLCGKLDFTIHFALLCILTPWQKRSPRAQWCWRKGGCGVSLSLCRDGRRCRQAAANTAPATLLPHRQTELISCHYLGFYKYQKFFNLYVKTFSLFSSAACFLRYY